MAWLVTTAPRCIVSLCVAWLGVAWLGVAWLGVAWLGVAWLGVAHHGPVVLRHDGPIATERQAQARESVHAVAHVHCPLEQCSPFDVVS